MDNPSLNWRTVGNKKVIKISKIIGRGSQSKIFRGSFNKKPVAVKRLEISENFDQESDILRNLDHVNVVKYFFTDTDQDFIFIVLEECDHTLQEYMEGKATQIRLSSVEILQQTSSGLAYLHKRNLIHRDLKPSNILFFDNGHEWLVKISDFNISKFLPCDRTSMTQSNKRGTVGYIAPEMLKKENARKESDVFSLGVIFHYVLSDGKHPFGSDIYKIESKIHDGDSPEFDELITKYADIVKPLISLMLSHNFRSRPSLNAVLAHPLFWDAEKTLHFIQEVSDYLESRQQHQGLICVLEERCKEVAADWFELLCSESDVKKVTLDKMTGKKSRMPTLQNLLRLIRNLKHHYNEKSDEFQNEVGSIPESFLEYFISRFPKLLPHTYNVMKSEPKFKQFYGLSATENQAFLHEQKQVPATACTDATMNDDDDDAEEMMETDGELLSLPEEMSEASCHTVHDDMKGKLVLRNYQMELAEQALAGHNSMIIAPTGSGKTAVANEIIRNHIEKRHSKCVMFLVSKTALARQQYEYFSRYLPCSMTFIIGEHAGSSPVGQAIKSKKLTVLTPQILINEISRRKPYVGFKDISMLIFDECHNTTKKHPYKVIMNMLLDYEKQKPSNQIQVVGLTASPGVGKGKDRESVMFNLLTLLASLNVTICPAIVEKHTDELKKHQKELIESYITVPTEDDIYSKKISKAMKLTEEKLCVSPHIRGQVKEPPEEKSKQLYENWAVDVSNFIKLNIRDTEASSQLYAYAQYLRECHKLLYLNKHIMNGFQVTLGSMSLDQAGEAGTYLRKLNNELEKNMHHLKVPLLQKLFEVLKRDFESNPESRCIIFVPRKLIATSLVQHLTEDADLAKLVPKFLTGSHSTMDGMTKTEQDQSLKSFRDGRSKILIATSVAEEGLDIRACNLVIMYNYVTGEVGRIQRSGRGRAENSRSILIASIDSSYISRDETNSICAQASEIAIEDLKEYSSEDILKEVRKIQRSERKERLREETQLQLSKDPSSKWRILCRKCKGFICNGDKLRHINKQHHVVEDPHFWSRVKRKPWSSEAMVAPGVNASGIFVCSNHECREYLGLEIPYKAQPRPALKISNIIFESDLGDIKSAKKWSKCPFTVQPIDEDSDEEMEEFNPHSSEPAVMKENKAFTIDDFNDVPNDEALELLDVISECGENFHALTIK